MGSTEIPALTELQREYERYVNKWRFGGFPGLIDKNTDPDLTLASLLLSDALDQEQKQIVRRVRTCLRFIRTTEKDVWPDDMANRITQANLDFNQMVREDATKRGIWLNDGYKLVQIMNDDTGEVQTTTVLKDDDSNNVISHLLGGKLGVFPQDPNQVYYGEGMVYEEEKLKSVEDMTPPEEVRKKRAEERLVKETQAELDRAAKQAKKNKKEKERRKCKGLSAAGGGKEDERAAEGEVAE